MARFHLPNPLKEEYSLLEAKKEDLEPLIDNLRQKISKSIKENKEFFHSHAEDIYVISCGFKEFIDPIVAGIQHTRLNVFTPIPLNLMVKENIIGFDENQCTCHRIMEK